MSITKTDRLFTGCIWRYCREGIFSINPSQTILSPDCLAFFQKHRLVELHIEPIEFLRLAVCAHSVASFIVDSEYED